MRYRLVIQFPGEQIEDFDRLLKLELDLDLSLGTEHNVDGHDFSSGKMNIFVCTDSPEEAYGKAHPLLAKFRAMDYVVACREFENDKYTVLYPSEFVGEFCIK